MYRDELLNLLTAMNNGDLAVKQDGKIKELATGNEWAIESVESVGDELVAELQALLKWAKTAPKYTAPGA